MAEPARIRYITSEDYLEMEAGADVRHEFVRGQVFAMTGATEAHNIICGNMFVALHASLEGSGCRVFINDMKLKVEAADSFYYPDLLVTCEPLNAKSVFKSSATLIVEVLSPSTKQIDRREKLVAYQQLKGLRQYVLFHQNRMLIEVYKRFSDDQWEFMTLRRSDQLSLEALPDNPLELNVDTVYRGLDLPPFVEESEEEYELA